MARICPYAKRGEPTVIRSTDDYGVTRLFNKYPCGMTQLIGIMAGNDRESILDGKWDEYATISCFNCNKRC